MINWKVTNTRLKDFTDMLNLLIRAKREIYRHTPPTTEHMLCVDIENFVNRHDDWSHIAVTENNGQKIIALTGYVGEQDIEESIRNANLIAQAPNMLRVVKAVATRFHDLPFGNEAAAIIEMIEHGGTKSEPVAMPTENVSAVEEKQS